MGPQPTGWAPFTEGTQHTEICSTTLCNCLLRSTEKFVYNFYTLLKMQKMLLLSLKLLRKQTSTTELHTQLVSFHRFYGKKLWHDPNQILSLGFFPQNLLEVKCAYKYVFHLAAQTSKHFNKLGFQCKTREFYSNPLKKNQKLNKQKFSHQKEMFLLWQRSNK